MCTGFGSAQIGFHTKGMKPLGGCPQCQGDLIGHIHLLDEGLGKLWKSIIQGNWYLEKGESWKKLFYLLV